MRRWMSVFALGGIVLLLGFSAPAQLAAAAAAPRLVVFEGFYSST